MKFIQKLSLLFCFGLLSVEAFSQEQNKQSPAHIGLIYPLSTHWTSAKQYTNHFSFHGLYGISGGEKGFGLYGIGSSVYGDSNGFQLSGIVNHIMGDAKGFGMAGITNISGNTSGIQIGGITNVSKNVTGFQLGGIANIAKDVKGLQFAGVINKAKKVKGVQFAGLVNIADSSDFPIAVLNFIKNGEKNIGVQFDELQNLTLALRTGGKYTYGILGVGYNIKQSAVVAEAGLGIHIPISNRFRIDTEITETLIFDQSKIAERTSLKVMPTFAFLPNLALFAGPSINHTEADATIFKDILPGWAFSERNYSNGNKSQWYVGYIAGVQFRF